MKTNEVVEVKPKFAISQIVQHAAGYGHKLFVIAVHTETCPGGTQVHYACRTIYRGSPSVDVVKFNEVELREFTADELHEQRQRDCIQWMVDSQNSAIDAKNFAKAAEWKRAKDLVIELQSNQEKETPIVPVRQKWQWPAWLKVTAVAMDKCGDWWTFEKRPICDESSGRWLEGTLWMLLSSELDWTPPPCDDWTKSLRINPNWKGEA